MRRALLLLMACDAPRSGADASTSDASKLDAIADVAEEPCATTATTIAPSEPTLTIIGDPGSPLGIYDPSIVYPKGAQGGVLSYSTVAPNAVHTRVAVSTDHGATFTYVADPNAVTPVKVTTVDPAFCDAGVCDVSGVLWREVSSIVADPTDPGAPFKVFFHTYAVVNNGAALRRDWGYIGLQTSVTLTT